MHNLFSLIVSAVGMLAILPLVGMAAGTVGTRKSPSGPAGTLAYSATVAPASISTLNTVETAVTLTGVKVGDVVTASPTSALTAGLCVAYVRVSAADTVQLAIANMTAGPLTPGSQTWYFRVNRA